MGATSFFFMIIVRVPVQIDSLAGDFRVARVPNSPALSPGFNQQGQGHINQVWWCMLIMYGGR